MVNEMSLRLEKLVEDIKEETILWPIEDAKNSPEEDAAWARIGAKHKMTGPHVKSIFKVLSKKYEVEKANPNTEWKLFSYLSFLDIKKENIDNNTDCEGDDNEEFVELLEVRDDYCSDDEEPNTSGSSFFEPTKNPAKPQEALQMPPEIQIRKIKNEKCINTEKKDSKNGTIKKIGQNLLSENAAKITTSIIGSQAKTHDQILRKSSSPNSIVVRIPMSASKAVSNQEKKTQSTLTSGLKLKVKKDEKQKEALSNLKEIKLKRKIENNVRTEKNEDDPPVKRQIVLPKGIRVLHSGSKSSLSSSKILSSCNELQPQNAASDSTNSNFMPISPTDKLPPFSSLLKKSPTAIAKDQDKVSQQLKIQHQKSEDEQQEIKTEILSQASSQSSSVSNKLTNNKMNGIDSVRKDFSEKGEATLEIEQISKDADENTEIKVKVLTEQAEKILPTFFRDLYNSKKYDSFGMYVSSTMNRLPSHLASKLEAKILQSIIEINAMVVDEHIEDI